MKSAGVDFTAVSFSEWTTKVEHHAAQLGDSAGAQVPASKLLEYYKNTFDQGRAEQAVIPRFDLQQATKHLQALRNSVDPVKSGLVSKFVEEWRKQW